MEEALKRFARPSGEDEAADGSDVEQASFSLVFDSRIRTCLVFDTSSFPRAVAVGLPSTTLVKHVEL